MDLYTSIPAAGVFRKVSCSDSLRVDILDRIVDSWHNADFQPVSINTNVELSSTPSLRAKLNNLGLSIVHANATRKPGFPLFLPNFKHFIQIASEGNPLDWVCICNSDIIIADPDSLQDSLRDLPRHCFGFANRMDLPSLESINQDGNHVTQQPYNHGFDFFVLTKAQLTSLISLLDNSLTFGLPWWDLVLPVSLLALGFQPRRLKDSHFIHISHDVRQWNWRFWNYIGLKSFLKLNNYATADHQFLPILSSLSSSSVISAIQLIKFRAILKLAILPGLAKYASMRRFSQLESLSHAMLNLIDHQS